MKKSMVFLIAALTFFLGTAGGVIIGIMAAPVKKGIHFSFRFNFKNCGNKKTCKFSDNNTPDVSSGPEKNICIPEVFRNKKVKKGKEKWIGRK